LVVSELSEVSSNMSSCLRRSVCRYLLGMDEDQPKTRRTWLWKAPLYLGLATLLCAIAFVWWQHGSSMREQRELYLIDTEPQVAATFVRYESGERGSESHGWVLVGGVEKELSNLWGVALLEPDQVITVVVDPAAWEFVVPVYVRGDLAEEFRLYPRILDEQEMFWYQLGRPLTWMAGGMFGMGIVGLVWFREWFSGFLRRSPGASPAERAREVTSGEGRSRSVRLGVAALSFAAAVVALVAFNITRLNLWGVTAAVVWFVTLIAMGVDYLSRRRNPALTAATQIGYLIGGVILVGWSQARPEDLISTRLPMASSVRTSGVVFGILILASVWWSLARRRQARNRTSPRATHAPAGVQPAEFQMTRRGYDTTDVDGLLARLTALPDTAAGRSDRKALVRGARFHLSRGLGYSPNQVDQYIDQLARGVAGGDQLAPISPTSAKAE